MSTDARCCPGGPRRSALQRAGRWAPGHAIGWGLAAVVLPKCPVCIAGYLAALGIGVGVGTTVAGVLRPLFITLALVATALTLAGLLRRCGRPKLGG